MSDSSEREWESSPPRIPNATGDIPPLRIHFGIVDYGSQPVIYLGNEWVESELLYRTKEPGAFSTTSIHLSRHMPKQLMDSMWVAGIRPSRDLSSTGEREAMKNHLGDLQRIIFKSYPVMKGK